MGSAWKVAYADFVTAMMAFFLLMWILNMTPPETKVGLAAFFAGDRNYDSSSTSPVSNNPFIQNTDKLDTREFKITEVEKSHYAIAQKLKQMIMADATPQAASGISADDVGVQLRVNSDLLFKSGTAELGPNAPQMLEHALEVLREYNLYLVVRGHADNEEVRPPYPSSWELSGARAAAVLHYLVEKGNIKATRLRGVAYADTRPLKPGADAESKSMNRRVEFFFHRPEVMSYSVVY
ncbi:MAG: flagellar motor protein MotB [Desulfovibrionaceae bacterium]